VTIGVFLYVQIIEEHIWIKPTQNSSM